VVISGRYIEPFAGSASLFFELQPERAILGDLNFELISTMRAMRRDVHRVIECIRRWPLGRRPYERIRALDCSLLSENERAARFIYLNHYCFNGLYRTNRNGEFNVPYGPPKKGKSRHGRIDEELLVRAAALLRHAKILNCDFEETLSRAEPGDFVYLDPPYAISNRRVFQEYLPGSFSGADLDRLSNALALLDKRGIAFMISYGYSAEARKLLSPWLPRKVFVRRNIAGFTGKRRLSAELVATNAVGGFTNADRR
jgi:DNA adenine methylase